MAKSVMAKSEFRGDAELCRRNGWTVGTRLVGDDGYGPTVIEITAIGEERLLAKTISPRWSSEQLWTLSCREWAAVVEVRVWDWGDGTWRPVDHPEPGWSRVGTGSDGAALYRDPELDDLAWVPAPDRPDELRRRGREG